jgi:hypothetical protein
MNDAGWKKEVVASFTELFQQQKDKKLTRTSVRIIGIQTEI